MSVYLLLCNVCVSQLHCFKMKNKGKKALCLPEECPFHPLGQKALSCCPNPLIYCSHHGPGLGPAASLTPLICIFSPTPTTPVVSPPASRPNSLCFHRRYLSAGCPTLVLTPVVKAAEVRNVAQEPGPHSHFRCYLTQGHKDRDVVWLTRQGDQFGQGYLAENVARASMSSPKSALVISSPTS